MTATTTTLANVGEPDDEHGRPNGDGGQVVLFPERPASRSPQDSPNGSPGVGQTPQPNADPVVVGNGPGTAVERQVFDAEIVDDEPRPGGDGPVLVDQQVPVVERSLYEQAKQAREAGRRPVLPAWTRSVQGWGAVAWWAAGYAGHTVAYHVVRLPLYAARLVGRSPRGLLRILVNTGRAVFDAESKPLRNAAIDRNDSDGYLKLVQERDLHVRHRLPVALVVLTVLAVAGLVLAWYAPWWAQALAVAGGALVCGAAGSTADKPVFDRAVVPTTVQKLTSDIIVRALGALGIAQINQAIAKGPGITFPAPITRDGHGWRAEVDLPYGVTAVDVMDRRTNLASGLRRPLGCVWPEPVSDEHAGRLVLWVGDQDMAKAKPVAWPLATHGTSDLFKTVPFGVNQRGRPVGVDLVFANMVIGAMPRYGKTFALRTLVSAAALDPMVELLLFELKGTGDLGMFEQVAHRYASGADDEALDAAMAGLRYLHAECQRRAKVITRIAKANRAACPENKVTPALSGTRRHGLHLLFAAIDECQELFSHPGYKDEAARLAEGIIKRGPAMGVILVLATQRPDAKSLPPGVSANAGLRYCLRVMGQIENDMVLGTSSYKNGIRATLFTSKDKGIGYLVGAGDDPQIVRGYFIDGPAAERIADRARTLRERAGTLTGHAAGEQDTNEATTRVDVLTDVATMFRAGEDKLWSDTILARLAEHRPDIYAQWNTASLAGALKPHTVVPTQVWATDPDTGRGRNRNGYQLADLTNAITHRQ